MKLKCIGLAVCGFLPYSYVFISAKFNPEVNWLGKPNFGNFLDLFTRAGYGSFTSSSNISHSPFLRLIDVYAFWDLLVLDFRVLGILLSIIGFVFIFLEYRKIFKALLIGTGMYLFFLYYASFPLVDNFMIATYERFLLPLYIFVVIYITYGISIAVKFIQLILRFIIKKQGMNSIIITFLFFIYPVSLFFINYPRISSLKSDTTAENLGRDILNSQSTSGILIMFTDTSLFDSQYVYLSERKWSDTDFIHLAKLYLPYYKYQLAKYSPDVYLPTNKKGEDIVRDFIEANYTQKTIYSKLSFKTDSDDLWVPWGMVFRYFKNEDLPDSKVIFDQNEKLWSTFYDPLEGALADYNHLMLSDVLRVYSVARQEIANWEINNGFLDEAIIHLNKAQKLTPKDIDIYHLLAKAYIRKKLCQNAESMLLSAQSIDDSSTDTLYLQKENQRDCFRDNAKSDYYGRLYNESIKAKEENLEKL